MIPKESGGDRGVLNISLLSAYHARSQAHWARELMNDHLPPGRPAGKLALTQPPTPVLRHAYPRRGLQLVG
jgi:hypothetical protein